MRQCAGAQLVVLYMKANLENVARISLPEGHTFCITVPAILLAALL